MDTLLFPVAIACYLYGAIPFGYVFTYLASGKRIYEGGSQNVGVANAFHTGGIVAGLLTVFGEVSKVIVPAGSAMYLFPHNTTVMLVFILSSFMGTNFSVFLKGKGGLGATIELWTLLFFSPYSAITLGAVFLIAYRVTKDTYYTVMITQAFLPVVLFIFERSVAWASFGAVILMVFLLKYRRSRDDFAYWRWGPRGPERR
jgi:glycerol-3-phosphate acyltransferase PlsY